MRPFQSFLFEPLERAEVNRMNANFNETLGSEEAQPSANYLYEKDNYTSNEIFSISPPSSNLSFATPSSNLSFGTSFNGTVSSTSDSSFCDQFGACQITFLLAYLAMILVLSLILVAIKKCHGALVGRAACRCDVEPARASSGGEPGRASSEGEPGRASTDGEPGRSSSEPGRASFWHRGSFNTFLRLSEGGYLRSSSTASSRRSCCILAGQQPPPPYEQLFPEQEPPTYVEAIDNNQYLQEDVNTHVEQENVNTRSNILNQGNN